MGGTSSAKAGRVLKRAKKSRWVSLQKLCADIDRGFRYFQRHHPSMTQRGLRDN